MATAYVVMTTAAVMHGVAHIGHAGNGKAVCGASGTCGGPNSVSTHDSEESESSRGGAEGYCYLCAHNPLTHIAAGIAICFDPAPPPIQISPALPQQPVMACVCLPCGLRAPPSLA